MPKTFTIGTYDKKHKENLAKRARKVQQLYDAAIKRIAQAAAPSLFDADPKTEFHFEDFPALKKEMEALMQDLGNSLQANIEDGDQESWTLSNTKNDAMVDSIIGKKKLPAKTVKAWKHPHLEALNAFIARQEAGMNLSRRVWNLTQQFKSELELALELGMGEGKSAAALSRDVRKYLVEPKKLFRRVRDKSGALRLSKAAAAYHPGQGVYRSSYKNALRMTATENNIAYRTADHNRWQALPFVIGIEIHISNNHPTEDICDLFDGKRFPKDFKFTGWHPWCRCYAVSVLASQEEMDAYTTAIMNGEDVSHWKFTGQVEKMPKEFTKWMKDNQQRIASAKNMPYFIKDNFKDGDPAKGLRWEVQKPDLATAENEADKNIQLMPGNNTPQKIEYEQMKKEEAVAEIIKQTGVTAEEADFMYESICDFSFGDYQDMRNVQMGGTEILNSYTSVEDMKKKINACEEFIKKSPKWDGGKTYRGVHISEEKMQSLREKMEKGETIDMNGMASWSTDKGVATGFTYPRPDRPVRVVFETEDAQYGTSIAHISINSNECEILCSMHNNYTITGITEEEGMGYTFYVVRLKNNLRLGKEAPAKTAHDIIMENAAKRHAARTSEQIDDIKDAWRERRLDAYDNRCDQLMKTLTYSQGQTLPALAKRQIALRNAIGKDASVKEVEALFAKFEKGVKAQNEWDTQVWGSFSKEQIANMKDIEKSLGIKKGRPMTYEEADRQSANPRHVNEYIADASSRIKIRGTNIHVRKNPLYDAAKHEQYGINCQTCAPAYALREWGFNIYAKGNTKALGDLSNYLSKGNNWLETWTEKDGSAVSITSFKDYLKAHPSWKHMTQQRYLQYFDDVCKEEGTYEVGLSWEPRGGHCTIVKRFSDGSIKYIEPQEDNSEGSGFEEKDIKYLCANMRKDPILKDGAIKVSDKLLNIKYVSIFLK